MTHGPSTHVKRTELRPLPPPSSISVFIYGRFVPSAVVRTHRACMCGRMGGVTEEVGGGGSWGWYPAGESQFPVFIEEMASDKAPYSLQAHIMPA